MQAYDVVRRTTAAATRTINLTKVRHFPHHCSPSLFAVRMSPSSSAHALKLCGYSEALLLYGLFRSMPVAVEVTSTLTNSEHWPSFPCTPSVPDMRPVPKLNTLLLVTCRQQVPRYRQSESFGHNAESLQKPWRLKYVPKLTYLFRFKSDRKLRYNTLIHILNTMYLKLNLSWTRCTWNTMYLKLNSRTYFTWRKTKTDVWTRKN
jgi:hypothetical protein